MRIAICEDNEKEQQRLSAAILDWAEARKLNIEIKCYYNADQFLFAWPDVAFDLIFLDINMGDMSGIELAKKIREHDKNVLIVFVTSFSQYVLEGYDVNALHYLIKPLSVTKLIPILDKANVVWSSLRKDMLIVSNDSGRIKLPYGNIYYISMVGHIAEICTENDVYELRKTAAEFEALLPTYFIRCHRSYIVNLLKADCVYKDSLSLSNEKTLPISRRNTKRVNDAFLRLFME
ncbi:MAG: LytTR family DNA-binding domain-containing protein [Defluviitaleaceae bacterium]|nr:LytTR family DNA-binding domain-containing protein [Defluviitaleaceae bacterium]